MDNSFGSSMYIDKSKNDTIAAAATAMSTAGIGIIRVSGPDAVQICASLYVNAKGEHDLKTHKANTITFGYIEDRKGNRIDEWRNHGR